jgi:hypothetical protein
MSVRNEKFSQTMQPNNFAKFLRKCKIYQLYRFIAISISMMWVILVKGH